MENQAAIIDTTNLTERTQLRRALLRMILENEARRKPDSALAQKNENRERFSTRSEEATNSRE